MGHFMHQVQQIKNTRLIKVGVKTEMEFPEYTQKDEKNLRRVAGAG